MAIAKINGVALASSGGADPDDQSWVYEETVTVPGSQAIAALLPSSGNFDTSKEYRVEFYNWSLASAGDFHSRVYQSGSLVTSASYERCGELFVPGTGVSVVHFGASGTSVISVSSSGAANSVGSGWIQFIPGLQATAKAPFIVKSRFIHSGGTVAMFNNVGALSTPTNAAIEKLQLYNVSINSISGTFILKSRPLTV